MILAFIVQIKPSKTFHFLHGLIEIQNVFSQKNHVNNYCIEDRTMRNMPRYQGKLISGN